MVGQPHLGQRKIAIALQVEHKHIDGHCEVHQLGQAAQKRCHALRRASPHEMLLKQELFLWIWAL